MAQRMIFHGLLITMLFLAAGCARIQFAPGDEISQIVDNSDGSLASGVFKLALSEASFSQESLAQNATSIIFSVTGANGNSVNSLLKTDFEFVENSSTIGNFTFSSNSQIIDQTVDIVFVLDITGSMKPTIQSAKAKIVNFINQTRAQKIHTRFCLVTFGDHTVNKCDKFADNDANNPNSAAQVQEFISRVTALDTPTGSGDYGGTDMDENQLRGLIDASAAPWLTGSQRFAILVTDAGFHYSPGNQGDSGADAPTYDEALAAIASSQMAVFAAAPHWSGYDRNFAKNRLGVVDASQGLYFNYDDLLSGVISFDTILNKVLQRVNTTYRVDYISEDNQQLDPTLPLTQRKLEVHLRSGIAGTVQVQSVQSNLPEGRPQYKNRWKLSDKQIKPETLQVQMNGQLLTSGYTLQNGEVLFAQTPAAGAKLDFKYEYLMLKDNLRMIPISVKGPLDVRATEVLFNGLLATPADYVLEKDLDGNYLLRPSDLALAEDDRFGIRDRGGLDIQVKGKVK